MTLNARDTVDSPGSRGRPPRGGVPRRGASRNELGAWGEEIASAYLASAGMEVLARNWRTRGGELDIIARDPARGALVAVEVKTRRSRIAGSPQEAISPLKLARLRALLVAWTMASGEHADALAVDVVGIDLVGSDDYALTHTKDLS